MFHSSLSSSLIIFFSLFISGTGARRALEFRTATLREFLETYETIDHENQQYGRFEVAVHKTTNMACHLILSPEVDSMMKLDIRLYRPKLTPRPTDKDLPLFIFLSKTESPASTED